MKHRFCPHPSPLPKGEGTRVLDSLLLGEKSWRGLAPLHEEGISYLHSATPNCKATLQTPIIKAEYGRERGVFIYTKREFSA